MCTCIYIYGGRGYRGRLVEEQVDVSMRLWEGRYTATWKREFKLPWRKAGRLISMIKWTRTSRLSIKISLSLRG